MRRTSVALALGFVLALETVQVGTAAATTPVGPVPAVRSWAAVDGVGVAWLRSDGATGYAVDRSIDGGATWERVMAPAYAESFADTTAPAASLYRVVPYGDGGEDLTAAATTDIARSPLTGWSAPAGAATLGAVDGTALAGSTEVTVSSTDVSAGRGQDGLPKVTLYAPRLGWHTGTMTIGASADAENPAASWYTGWSSVNPWSRVLSGEVVVTRAVLRADGSPVELAVHLSGVREGEMQPDASRLADAPVRALVLVDSVAAGLPAHVVPEPHEIAAQLPEGFDRTWPVVLRNVGGTPVTLTARSSTSAFASPPDASAWSAATSCLGPVLAAGGTCSTSVRALAGSGYPRGYVRWTAPGGIAVQLFGNGSYSDPADRPVLSLSGPSLVRTAATITVAASDPQGSEVTRWCRLDSGPFNPCGASWSLSGLRHGQHLLTAYAVDAGATMSNWVRATLKADSQGPVSRITTPTSGTPVLFRSTTTVYWTVTDGPAEVSNLYVHRRTATLTTGYSSYAQVCCSTGTNAQSTMLYPGQEQCWGVRGRDSLGNVGAWSADRCFVTPLDDRSLTLRNGARLTKSYAYRETVTRIAGTNSTLSLAGVTARQVGVVVTTCPVCGPVAVYLGGTRVGTLSTYSSTTHAKVVLWLPRWTSARTGTLTLRPTSNSPVHVDGVVARHA